MKKENDTSSLLKWIYMMESVFPFWACYYWLDLPQETWYTYLWFKLSVDWLVQNVDIVASEQEICE